MKHWASEAEPACSSVGGEASLAKEDVRPAERGKRNRHLAKLLTG
jgi:hypothetical protein